MQETKRTQKIDPKVIAAVIATGLMSFCGVIVETSMNVTFPTLMKQFNVTTSTVQWMTTGYLLTVAIIVPLSATFKRRFKTKSLFITANLLFMAGVLIDQVICLSKAGQKGGNCLFIPRPEFARNFVKGT